jgi:hypothetical protein
MNTAALNAGINRSIMSTVRTDQSQKDAPNVKGRIGIEMKLDQKRMACEDA